MLAVAALAGTGAASAQGMAAHAPVAASARAATADAAARDFYRWYVGLMAHDKEATDEPATYARYVSRALRAQIARKMASADGMDVDCFTKTQDYLDDWLRQVAATPVVMHGASARTVVTLGSGGKRQRLAVALLREDGLWKISAVTPG